MQEHDLIAQHVTGGAQFAGIFEALAQEPRRRIGAAIGISGDIEYDQREALEIVFESVEVFACAQNKAERRIPRNERVAVCDKARLRDDSAAGRQRRIVRRQRPFVLDESVSSKNRHASAPYAACAYSASWNGASPTRRYELRKSSRGDSRSFRYVSTIVSTASITPSDEKPLPTISPIEQVSSPEPPIVLR